MSAERSKNIKEANDTFEFFAECIDKSANAISWEPEKDRVERTEYVLALMSYWRLLNDEYIFLNKRHLASVVDSWKEWKAFVDEKDYEELVSKWIREYEERLKSKEKLGEIGERFVDLASSTLNVPIYFSFILEYEAEPYWGSIIYDFRKLLSVLSPVKVGIFHLPKFFSTSQTWVPDEKTGEIKWKDKILDCDKPDELIEDMRNEIRGNELEPQSTVYLIMLLHSQNEKTILHGYLLWREIAGEVHSEKLTWPNQPEKTEGANPV